VQIWTALIAMLLVRYLQLRSTFGWSLSNLIALLRHQLFVYRNLIAWLNQPYEPPPERWAADQLPLALVGQQNLIASGNLAWTTTIPPRQVLMAQSVRSADPANLDSTDSERTRGVPLPSR
jgi:hypothetical protein